jgi:hypothetical protein
VKVTNSLTQEVTSIDQPTVLITDKDLISSTHQISQKLHWLKSKYRVYSHEFPIQKELNWEGSAEALIINSSRLNEEISISTESQRSFTYAFQKGVYSLRLLSKNKESSEPFLLEVLEAPVIRYFSPLPRERILNSQTTDFVWSAVPLVEKYKLLVQNEKQTQKEKVLTTTQTQMVIEDQRPLIWTIWGIDPEGFEIPPKYSYEIFPSHQLFGAPKILSIEIRKPASDTPLEKEPSAPIEKDKFEDKKKESNKDQSWLQFLFPQAHANESTHLKEVRISWEPIPGADHYSIEISSDPSFLQPELIDQTTNSFYNWKTQSEKETYYFRIAAGHKTGRLGLFTPPTLINMKDFVSARGYHDLLASNLESTPTSTMTSAPTSATKDLSQIKSQNTPLPEPISIPIQSQELKNQEVPPISKIENWDPVFLFRTQLVLNQYHRHFKTKNDFQVKQNYILESHLQLATQIKKFNLQFEWMNHKLNSKAANEFQDSLQFHQYRLAGHFRWTQNHAIGLVKLTDTYFKRTGFESIKPENIELMGFSYEYQRKWHYWNFSGQVQWATTEMDQTQIHVAARVFNSKAFQIYGLLVGAQIYFDQLESPVFKAQGESMGAILGWEW